MLRGTALAWRITSFFVICFVVFGGYLSAALKVRAAVPNNIISYQGRILNTSGAPVADATLSMTFRLFDAVSGGTCLWSNISSTCASNTARSVTLTDGLFSENLGDTGASYAGIPDSVFQNNAAVYLQIEIGGEALTPRKLLTAAPYAINSSVLDGIDSTGFLQTTGGSATGNYTFTGAVFTGANPLVFEGSTNDDFETTFAIGDPGTDQTITFQNATGTVALLSDVTASASKWTDAGTVTYLTSTTDDLAVGGTTTSSAAFAVNASTNGVILGTGSGTNASLTLRASDGDLGNFTYDTDDTLRFHGGDVGIDQNLSVTGGQISLPTAVGTFTVNDGGTFNFSDGTNTLFQVVDNGTTGSVTASGDVFSTNGIFGTTGTSLRMRVGNTGTISFQDSASNTLFSVIDVGTSGNATVSGTLGVASGTIGTTATAMNMVVANTGTYSFGDGTNPFLTLTDAGTTGNAVVTGTLRVQGNLINGNAGALVLGNGGGTTYIAVGGGTPGTVSGSGDLYVTNGLEVDGAFNGTTGNFTGAVTATGFLCTDCIIFDQIADSLSLDATTTISSTSGRDFIIDVGASGSGGDFQIRNTTGTYVTFGDNQSTTFAPNTTSGTAFTLNAGSVNTGMVMSLIDNALTTGTILSINGSSAAMTSGDLINASNNSSVGFTTTMTGNIADFSRNITVNGGGATVTLGGPVARISSNMSVVAGTGVDNGGVFAVSQDNASATGTAQAITSLATSGTILSLSGPNFTDDTGLAVVIDVQETTATADLLRIETDFGSANNSVLRIEANGGVYTDVGMIAGTGAGTTYGDNEIKGSAAFSFSTPTSFTWSDDATNTLMTLTDAGTSGNLSISNDLTVTGSDISGDSATALRLNASVSQLVAVGSNSGSVATGGGDLLVSDNFEVLGSSRFGSPTSTVTFAFESSETTQPLYTFNAAALLDDTAMLISRSGAGGDFDGTATRGLVAIEQSQSSGTSDGEALTVINQGAGSSTAVRITQNGVDAPSSGSTAQQALVIDVNEAAGDNAADEDVMIIRSDADGGTPDTEFRFQLDGDALADGSFTGGGADFAEFFLTRDTNLGDNDVACRDMQVLNAVKRCEAGNRNVVGVISNTPSFVGNNIPGADRDLRGDPNYRIVGLLGQISTKVTTVDGAIAVGDPITTSSTVAGFGAKAHGPVQIIGHALEPLSSGTGMIKVLVMPMWYAGDVFSGEDSSTLVSDDVALAALAEATASVPTSDSHLLSFRGSAWDGSTAQTREMVMLADVSNADVYGISVRNTTGDQVAHISQDGDLAIAGKLYPSDRGQLQTDKYIYFDGSVGDGYMRTNAAGWATGSYDFAEMFPSTQEIAAGEVVVFAADNAHVQRSTGATYDEKIAGVISTRPGFLAGEQEEGSVPVALAGRVPTYVSGENGAVMVGDPLTTSTRPGYAMKATEPGPIVGYAMEPFTGSTGVITAVIRPSYYDGGPVEEAPEADNEASQLVTISDLDVTGSLNMNSGSILAIGSLSGLGNTWRLDENGDFITNGRLATRIHSSQGEDVSTYAVTSTDTLLQLSGTSTLSSGTVLVNFEDVDPRFNDVIAADATYRVFLTPSAPTGQLYAVERTNIGFEIREVGGNTTGVTVDWMVMAYRKDFAPASATTNTTPDVIAPVEEDSAPPEASPVEEELVSDGEATSEEPTDDSAPSGAEAPSDSSDDAFAVPEEGEDVIPTPDVPVEEPVSVEVSEDVPEAGTESEPTTENP